MGKSYREFRGPGKFATPIGSRLTSDDTLRSLIFRSTAKTVSGCRIWTGFVHPNGYATCDVGSFDGHRLFRMAHRVSFELENGPIANGLDLDHKCRDRSCVAPAHLEPVSHVENLRRGERFTKTHCVRGHEYTDATVYCRPDRDGRSGRGCRVCRRMQGGKKYILRAQTQEQVQ